MKNIKKLLSIVMVLAMVLSLGVSAFAATITITDDHGEGSTYEAYQLLNLTTAEGTDASNKADPNKGFAYTVNPKYRSILEKVTNLKDEPDQDRLPNEVSKIVTYIEGLDTAAKIQEFADKVFDEIVNAKISPEEKSNGTTFSDVEQGYYLIAEVLGGDSEAVRSLVMLDTAGQQDINVKTKEDKPHSEKEVKETNDTTGKVSDWVTGADYDIGDEIPFRLSGTVQNEGYAEYDEYYLSFVDDMSAGLGAPKSVKIYWMNEGTEVDVTRFFTAVGPTDSTQYAGGHIYTWTCDDIKAEGIEIPAGTTVYVEYTAELLSGAVIGGTGNPNSSHIVYSNNPYGEGTTHTPDDKVTVFTFTLNVNKVQPGDTEGRYKPLEGAGFTLLKKVPTPDGVVEYTKYEELKTAVKGAYYQDEDNNVYQVVYPEVKDVTTFTFTGLDAGEYLLIETTVPAGFNKAEDIEFKVEGVYDEPKSDNETPTLKDLTVTVTKGTARMTAQKADGDIATGYVATDVVNRSGMELPETGGIGTTIFYVVGAVLVVGAVILLVTRKRVSGAEK